MPRALVSVWDKTGLIGFCEELVDNGWDLLASGGTARALQDAGLPVQFISEQTGEGEMLGGRVKTLHPAIHASILARDTTEDLSALDERGWKPIDMVIVNLYPFESVAAQEDAELEKVIENIDIGGVALLRAAAKNFTRVTVLCDPEDYKGALDPPNLEEFRLRMAMKAFLRTTAYDSAIMKYLHEIGGQPRPFSQFYYPSLELRYGENPHQEATYYSEESGGGPLGGKLLQGKALSYNNLLDLDAAWRAAIGFEEPAVVVIKHLSPCGIAISKNIADAVPKAIASDPVSAFGSVIAANRLVDEDFLEGLGDLFVECLVAPKFGASVIELFERKPNLRLLLMPDLEVRDEYEFRSVIGGLLRQSVDHGDPTHPSSWQVVTKRQPTDKELCELRFAWKACQPVKSNAILLARSESDTIFTVGIGGGQPNRVDSVRIAGERAGKRAVGSVLASDAFFPFPDGVEVAADLGVTAVVQPGGSRMDEAVIEAANAAGLAMVFTGIRHFRH
jgi:phosphoribosylaminoimidazolecarboxamide formyltransferase/IMP cyclohydrolase